MNYCTISSVGNLLFSANEALVKHPLTDKGIETFLADWKKTGQAI